MTLEGQSRNLKDMNLIVNLIHDPATRTVAARRPRRRTGVLRRPRRRRLRRISCSCRRRMSCPLLDIGDCLMEESLGGTDARGLCDTGSSWFFHPCDGRGQSGIDRSGSFADVGSPPPPSAAGVKLGRVIARHRAAVVRELKSLRPARKSQGRANAAYSLDVCECLVKFIGLFKQHSKPRHSEVR